MITVDDAKYVLSEIRQLNYYERKMAWLNYQLVEYDMMIADLTAPASPNGGNDVVVKGKEIRVKIVGSGGTDKGALIADYLTAMEPLEESLKDFERRYRKAVEYKNAIVKSNDEFAIDYLEGQISYKDLEKKYLVKNVPRTMLQKVMQYVKSL